MADCVQEVEKEYEFARAAIGTFKEDNRQIKTCAAITVISGDATEWALKEEKGSVLCFLKGM